MKEVLLEQPSVSACLGQLWVRRSDNSSSSSFPCLVSVDFSSKAVFEE